MIRYITIFTTIICPKFLLLFLVYFSEFLSTLNNMSAKYLFSPTTNFLYPTPTKKSNTHLANFRFDV